MSHDSHMVTMPNIYNLSIHSDVMACDGDTHPEHITFRECLILSRAKFDWDHMSHDSHMVTMPNIFYFSMHSAIMACNRDTHPEHIKVRGCIILSRNKFDWDHVGHDSHIVTMTIFQLFRYTEP